MLLVALFVAAADTGGVAESGVRAGCGADSLYTIAPVYVLPRLTSARDSAAANSVLLVAQEAATRIRILLGARADSVVRADTMLVAPQPVDGSVSGPNQPTLNGHDTSGVRVVAERGGAVHWIPSRTPPSSGARLLDRALATVRDSGDLFISSDAIGTDSLVFTLDYVYGLEPGGGRPRARLYGPAPLVAFVVRAGVEHLAAAIPGTIRPEYPRSGLSGGANAVVILQFVVDTSGRAVTSTVHDVWSTDRPRLTGELGEYYAGFVKSATDAVLRGRFTPAEIAGCRVRQLVQLPFTFHLNR